MLVCVGVLVVGGCARSPRAAPPRTDTGAAAVLPAAVATTTHAPTRLRADSFDATVAKLRSDDFETRTRAARALVDAGQEALPALGRAGAAPVPVGAGIRVSSTRAVIETILARAPEPALESAVASEWAVVRCGAAAELGRRERWDAVPLLIVRLDDPDPDVRAAAGSALRRLTNNFFGFRAQARVDHRRRAAGRWRAWWSQEGRAEAQERAARIVPDSDAR